MFPFTARGELSSATPPQAHTFVFIYLLLWKKYDIKHEHINKKISLYKILCVCMCMYVWIHMSHSAFGSQNTTLCISSHLLLCLRQGHLLLFTAYIRLEAFFYLHCPSSHRISRIMVVVPPFQRGSSEDLSNVPRAKEKPVFHLWVWFCLAVLGDLCGMWCEFSIWWVFIRAKPLCLTTTSGFSS